MFFLHYIGTMLDLLLLIVLPSMQAFSAFAFLKPLALFGTLTGTLMEAINFNNFTRQLRITGGLLISIWNTAVDTVKGFPFYVTLIPSLAKAVLNASHDNFKFLSTVKGATLSKWLSMEEHFNNTKKQTFIASTKPGTGKRFIKIGIGLIAAGVVIGSLLTFGFTLVFSGFGLALILSGYIVEYKSEAKKQIPIDGVFGIIGILGWMVTLFFTSGMGPVIASPYLLASISFMTGTFVFNYFKSKSMVNGKPLLNGMQMSAMFSKPAQKQWFKLLGLSAGIICATQIISGIFAMVGVVEPTMLLYVLWAVKGITVLTAVIAILKGAFSSVLLAISETLKNSTIYFGKDHLKIIKTLTTIQKTDLKVDGGIKSIQANMPSISRKHINVQSGFNLTEAVKSLLGHFSKDYRGIVIGKFNKSRLEVGLHTVTAAAPFFAPRAPIPPNTPMASTIASRT